MILTQLNDSRFIEIKGFDNNLKIKTMGNYCDKDKPSLIEVLSSCTTCFDCYIDDVPNENCQECINRLRSEIEKSVIDICNKTRNLRSLHYSGYISNSVIFRPLKKRRLN